LISALLDGRRISAGRAAGAESDERFPKTRCYIMKDMLSVFAELHGAHHVHGP